MSRRAYAGSPTRCGSRGSKRVHRVQEGHVGRVPDAVAVWTPSISSLYLAQYSKGADDTSSKRFSAIAEIRGSVVQHPQTPADRHRSFTTKHDARRRHVFDTEKHAQDEATWVI